MPGYSFPNIVLTKMKSSFSPDAFVSPFPAPGLPFAYGGQLVSQPIPSVLGALQGFGLAGRILQLVHEPCQRDQEGGEEAGVLQPPLGGGHG